MPVGNLEFITQVTGGSGASTFSIDNVFSDNYDVYYASFDVGTGSTGTSSELRLLDSSGTVISASEYDMARLGMPANASFSENRFTSANSISQFNYSYSTGIGGGNAVYFFNPYDSASYTFIVNQGSFWNGSNGFGTKQIGVHKSAETIRGFHLLRTSGTWTADTTISVYGVK